MSLRYPGTCVRCSEKIGKSGPAFWDADARAVTCLRCHVGNSGEAPEGSGGEERLARYLGEISAVIVLHDRRMPRSPANIDHLAVAPSGVFVIDAKRYAGMVRIENPGGLFRFDPRLRVGGRDCTKLLEGALSQRNAVVSALEGMDVPVRTALCFVEAEWGWFAKPTLLRGVWILGQKSLVRKLSEPGSLPPARVRETARLLAERFPPR